RRAGAASRVESTSSGQKQVTTRGCPVDRGSNIRVNQECLNQADPDLQGRGQAQNETGVAQDPSNPQHLVASSNDYRRGDGNCYAYYSTDDGKTWRDSTVPMSFTRGDAFGGTARQYWQAGGDTSVAWDTKGNAYLSCLTFQRGAGTTQDPDASSAFYVFRSTGTNGSSWNFPARPVDEFNDPNGEGTTFLDKQYLTVDNHRGSRFQDRVYVTWTRFDPDGTAYIYAANSRDYGESFSSPKLVSRTSALCSNTQGAPTPQGTCNVNQFSQPFTAPDGTLYVVWDNYNLTGVRPGEEERSTAAAVDNRGQVLLAKSTDGGNTFSAPVKVADYYDLPDCETYQEASEGVACVPEKGETQNSIFRAANYPVGSVNPRDSHEVDVTFGSYINAHSKASNGCVPQGYNPDTFQPLYTGVKTAGACNNDIVVSRSTNSGQTFTGGTANVRALPTVRNDDHRTDQFWQWATFDPQGRLAVSYYDRNYGNAETTGFSDVSLSGSRNGRDFATTRVTTASMPPATQFEGGFFGDYSALSADDTAHPTWMDTRDPNLIVCRDSAGQVVKPPRLCTASAPNAAVANDQNVYTRSLAIPLP
ncbi:MAG: hypothetical protein QOD71_3529, partial [Thermoleophilaceae bacterium]|nr:hypothetical protein [Thermoleophilaceae bacterium]